MQQLKDLSHKVAKAGKAAEQVGLNLIPDHFALLEVVDSYDNVIRSRYITTGAYTRPEEQALSEFCEFLDSAVGDRLIADGHSVRKTTFSAPQPVQQTIADHLAEDIETLSKKEREIIAYLLQHNQRMFTCDADGGHAGTLLSRGIVRDALRPGQIFAYDDMPVEIPREVWRFLKANVDKFPYEEDQDGGHPWRKHWME